ncbi:MAG: hypothetical protein AAF458_09720 [Pseudomonadota bacterium]
MSTTEQSVNQTSQLRFYFMAVVWGVRFRQYFTELCLPSLLAPGNLPQLPDGDHRFLIACPDADWEALMGEKAVQAVARHLTLEHLPIPPPPPGVPGTVHMGAGHKAATDRCFDDGALAVPLTPDLMLSRGTVARLVEYAKQRYSVVCVAALRFGEEPLFERLRRGGHLNEVAGNLVAGGDDLSLSGADMVELAVNSMHSQTEAYLYDSPAYRSAIQPALIWRHGLDGGLLIHSLSWAPLLLDFASIEEHDTESLTEWTMDGDYVHANFGVHGRVRIIDDSDEMMLISWAPLDDRPVDVQGNWLRRWCGPLRRVLNGASFRDSARCPAFDDFKRKYLSTAVCWHIKPLDRSWDELAMQSRSVVDLSEQRNDTRARQIIAVLAWLERACAVIHSRMVSVWRALNGDPLERENLRRALRRRLHMRSD